MGVDLYGEEKKTGPLVPLQFQWPHENPECDLTVDPKARLGRLPNGMRYALYKNNTPPGKVSARLVVQAGSLMETDSEQGLAHFLEHLAFNGTQHFPENTLIAYFQRLGMDFGHHTNAHTGFDETVYKLELPFGDQNHLDDALIVFRDYADGITMTPEAIEGERGVILAEKAQTDSFDRQAYQQTMSFLFNGTLLPERFPIGQESIIKSATREDFFGFYKKWYCPERLIVILAGDFDLDLAERLIQEKFASLVPSTLLTQAPKLHLSIPQAPFKANVYTHKEADAVYVSLMTLKEKEHWVVTQEAYERRLQEKATYLVLKERLDQIRKANEGAITSVDCAVSSFLNQFEFSEVEVITNALHWEETVRVVEQFIRKAVQYGVTETELSVAKDKLLKAFRQAAAQANTRASSAIADDFTRRLMSNEVFIDPNTAYMLAQKAMESITPVKVLAILRDHWQNRFVRLFMIGNEDLIAVNGDVLTETYNKSRSTEVMPPVEEAVGKFAYNHEPNAPWALIQQTTHSVKSSFEGPIDVFQGTFTNGVHLTHVQTKFLADSILLRLRLGGGGLELRNEQFALKPLAAQAFLDCGLKKHTYEALQKLLAGYVIDLNFGVEADSFVFTGSTDLEGLTKMLETLQAYLQEPAYREESIKIAREKLKVKYRELEHDPVGVLRKDGLQLIANRDARFGMPELNSVLQANSSAMIDWLGTAFKEGYMELTIVGDCTKDQAVQKVGETLAQLGQRKLDKNYLPKAKPAQVLQTPKENYIYFDSEFDKSLACAIWKYEADWDVQQVRKLNVLSAILEDKMLRKIREEMGIAYGVQAFSDVSLVYKNFGYLMALSFVGAKNTEKAVVQMKRLAKDILENGISKDELERAINPMVNTLEQREHTNEYWLGKLDSSHERPMMFEWVTDPAAMYKAFTPSALEALAKEVFHSEAISLIIMPRQSGGNLHGDA